MARENRRRCLGEVIFAHGIPTRGSRGSREMSEMAKKCRRLDRLSRVRSVPPGVARIRATIARTMGQWKRGNVGKNRSRE